MTTQHIIAFVILFVSIAIVMLIRLFIYNKYAVLEHKTTGRTFISLKTTKEFSELLDMGYEEVFEGTKKECEYFLNQ